MRQEVKLIFKCSNTTFEKIHELKSSNSYRVKNYFQNLSQKHTIRNRD